MRYLPSLALATLVGALILPATNASAAEVRKDGKGQIRKDPKGQTGISPYNELLAEGRKAIAADDKAGAVAAFKKAIAAQPDEMYGYLLLAQAELRAGDAATALKTVETVRKKKGTEAVQAKMLLLHANLDEQRANVLPPGHKDAKGVKPTSKDVWDLIKETLSAYKVFVTAHSSLPNYKATADDRKKKVDERVQREKDYGAVAERIKKKQAERDKKKK